MTTKVNPFAVPTTLELRIILDPATGKMEIRSPRGIPTISALAMLIDALQNQFQFFVKQTAGIVGQKNPVQVDSSIDNPEHPSNLEPGKGNGSHLRNEEGGG